MELQGGGRKRVTGKAKSSGACVCPERRWLRKRLWAELQLGGPRGKLRPEQEGQRRQELSSVQTKRVD